MAIKIPKEEEKEWAIVELMGHIKLSGRLTEVERFGAKMGRLDIPVGKKFVTQFFSGSSVYRITPTTEEIARAIAQNNKPEPVNRWELSDLTPKLTTGERHQKEIIEEDEHPF